MLKYQYLCLVVMLSFWSLDCQEPGGHQIPLHNLSSTESPLDLAPVDLRVSRVSGPAQLSVGATWELHARARDPEGGEVTFQWTATSGTLSRNQGKFTYWTANQSIGRAEIEVRALDKQGNQSGGTFAVRVPDGAAKGPVMDVRDYVGSYCSLAIDSGDHPHIAFYNSTHPALLYAFHNGSQWQIETIEGYGLDVGGAAGEFASLALDSSGIPHIAYVVNYAGESDLSLNYASKASGSWQLVTVDSTDDRGRFNVNMDINPATQKPEIFYLGSTQATIKHAVCSGTCTQAASWNPVQVYEETRGRGASYNYAFAGGFAIQSDGTRHASIGARFEDFNYDDQAEVIYAVNGGAAWDTSESATGVRYQSYYYDDSDASRLVLDRNDQPLLLNYEGVYHRTGAGNWSLSRVEESILDSTGSDYARFDIFCDRAHTPPSSGVVWIASPHSGSLELVNTNARSYFEYTYVGSITGSSESRASVAADSAGVGHLCWVDNGVLMYE